MSYQREIKFRAWDNIHKCFDSVVAANLLMQLHDEDQDVDEEYGIRFFLMQYTGLKDNTGKEIYEGDILHFNECKKYKIWREKGGLVINCFQDDFKKEIPKIDLWEAIADNQTISFIEGCLTVIGNIYENPELLEVGSNAG